MFRAECKAGTPIGKMACGILARGELVPDGIVNEIVAGRIARRDCANGFLLDGYPRTVPQAAYFRNLLTERRWPGPVVVHLDVPVSSLVARLTARRQCPKCLSIYNLLSHPPRRDGHCDRDAERLITREDDREEVIRERMRAYRELTDPVLAWYGPEVVRTVDGTAPTSEVTRAVERWVRASVAQMATTSVAT
jgi:adenylate kinase